MEHVECDRFHGRPAITAMRAEPADEWLWHKGVEVHLGDAVDRVDERDRVGAAAFCGAGGGGDVGDVGRQFRDHGNGRGFHHPLDNRLGDIRILANGRAHPAFAHAMRAAKVQFDPVRAAIGRALDEVVPVLARVDHERGDDGVVRPALFHLRDLAKVGLRRAVADQLDVVQANHAHVAVIDRGIARGDVADRVADRFPNDAAPASFKGAMGLVSGVARRTGSDPEWVGGFDPGEVGGKISHLEK